MHPTYKRMLKLMQAKEETSEAAVETWFLYILECRDGVFYTGITKDIERRIKMHNSGKASRFTRARRPVKVIYQETLGSRTQALVRECRVKTFSRKEKETLIGQSSLPRRRKRKTARNLASL